MSFVMFNVTFCLSFNVFSFLNCVYELWLAPAPGLNTTKIV